jgi:L-asparaginase
VTAAVKFAFKKNIPVVVDAQCLEVATLMHLYDVGKQALDKGVIQAYDTSTECIITKLMWALKHADSYENIREIMHTDYFGELNKEARLY